MILKQIPMACGKGLRSMFTLHYSQFVCGCYTTNSPCLRKLQTFISTSSSGVCLLQENRRKLQVCVNQYSVKKPQMDIKPPAGLAATLVDRSPEALKPYLKLMRIDRPIGSWLLFWPCAWSTAMAADPGGLPDLKTLMLFGLGAFFMRGAGCTINDMWDQDIDGKVARTRDRPLVSGAVSSLDALMCLAGQIGIGGLILLQLNWYSVVLGVSSLGLVVVYPLMKRITHWPQLVLGMTFNWGALLGWAAVKGACDWAVCAPLYAACICWTLVYDTIYAHQDKADDLLLGIKSTAIKFGDRTKLWLSGFGATMVSGLVAAGANSQQTWPYYTAVGLVAAHVASQLYTLDVHNPADCGQKFVSNHHIGLLLFGGIVAGSLLKHGMDSSLQDHFKESKVPAVC